MCAERRRNRRPRIRSRERLLQSRGISETPPASYSEPRDTFEHNDSFRAQQHNEDNMNEYFSNFVSEALVCTDLERLKNIHRELEEMLSERGIAENNLTDYQIEKAKIALNEIRYNALMQRYLLKLYFFRNMWMEPRESYKPELDLEQFRAFVKKHVKHLPKYLSNPKKVIIPGKCTPPDSAFVFTTRIKAKLPILGSSIIYMSENEDNIPSDNISDVNNASAPNVRSFSFTPTPEQYENYRETPNVRSFSFTPTPEQYENYRENDIQSHSNLNDSITAFIAEKKWKRKWSELQEFTVSYISGIKVSINDPKAFLRDYIIDLWAKTDILNDWITKREYEIICNNLFIRLNKIKGIKFNNKDLKLIYGFIYLITNSLNKKKYVGQTINSGGGLHRRWSEHKSYGRIIKQQRKRNRKVSGSHFGNAIAKYEQDVWIVEILDIAYSQDELDKKEIHYINKYETLDREKGYNTQKGGSTGLHTIDIVEKVAKKRQENFYNKYKNKITPAGKLIWKLKRWYDKSFGFIFKYVYAEMLGFSESGITFIMNGETKDLYVSNYREIRNVVFEDWMEREEWIIPLSDVSELFKQYEDQVRASREEKKISLSAYLILDLWEIIESYYGMLMQKELSEIIDMQNSTIGRHFSGEYDYIKTATLKAMKESIHKWLQKVDLLDIEKEIFDRIEKYEERRFLSEKDNPVTEFIFNLQKVYESRYGPVLEKEFAQIIDVHYATIYNYYSGTYDSMDLAVFENIKTIAYKWDVNKTKLDKIFNIASEIYETRTSKTETGKLLLKLKKIYSNNFGYVGIKEFSDILKIGRNMLSSHVSGESDSFQNITYEKIKKIARSWINANDWISPISDLDKIFTDYENSVKKGLKSGELLEKLYNFIENNFIPKLSRTRFSKIVGFSAGSVNEHLRGDSNSLTLRSYTKIKKNFLDWFKQNNKTLTKDQKHKIDSWFTSYENGSYYMNKNG